MYTYSFIYIYIAIYRYIYIYNSCIYELVFGFIIRPFDYGSFQNTRGISRLERHQPGQLRRLARGIGCRALSSAAWGRIVGGWKKRCRWWVIWACKLQAFGQATFQHTKLLQQLLLSHSISWRISASRRNAGKTVRAMEGVGSTGRFVFAFFHGPKCWAKLEKKVTYRQGDLGTAAWDNAQASHSIVEIFWSTCAVWSSAKSLWPPGDSRSWGRLEEDFGPSEKFFGNKKNQFVDELVV